MKNPTLKVGMWLVILLIIVGAGWYLIMPSSFFASLPQPKIKTKNEKDHDGVSLKKSELTFKELSRSDSNSKNDLSLQSTSHDHTSPVSKGKRSAVLESHRKNMEARERYMQARHRWRRELNRAWQQAKKDGDYTVYNMLKEQEPNKDDFLKK